jgi:hypothetical protein
MARAHDHRLENGPPGANGLSWLAERCRRWHQGSGKAVAAAEPSRTRGTPTILPRHSHASQPLGDP